MKFIVSPALVFGVLLGGVGLAVSAESSGPGNAGSVGLRAVSSSSSSSSSTMSMSMSSTAATPAMVVDANVRPGTSEEALAQAQTEVQVQAQLSRSLQQRELQDTTACDAISPGATIPASPVNFIANYKGASPAISGDGSTVAYIAITPSEAFLMVYDAQGNRIGLVTLMDGYPTNGGSSIDISEDGSVIVVGLEGQFAQVFTLSGSPGSYTYIVKHTFSSLTLTQHSSVSISDDGTVIAVSDPDETASTVLGLVLYRAGVVRVYVANQDGDWPTGSLPKLTGNWADDQIGTSYAAPNRRGGLVVAKTSTGDIYVALVGALDYGVSRVYKYDVSQTTNNMEKNQFPGWRSMGDAVSSPASLDDIQDGRLFMDFVVSSIDDTLMLAVGRDLGGPVEVYRYIICNDAADAASDDGSGTWVRIGADIPTVHSDYPTAIRLGATNCKLSADGTTLTVGFMAVLDEATTTTCLRRARSVLYQLDAASDEWIERKTTYFGDEGSCDQNQNKYADTVDLSANGQTLIIGNVITGTEIYDVSSCLSTDTITTIPGDCSCDDKCVLKALYDATAGDGWTDNTNWNFDDLASDPCSISDPWHGITCTDGKVSAISLAGNNLDSTIPTAIGLLTTLTILDLYSNKIIEPIPTEIGTLSSLSYLNLDDNWLTGTIPTEIGQLTSLSELYLSSKSNQLSGTIPSELGNLEALTYLWISNNRIEDWTVYPSTGIYGTIPTELGRLTNLYSLRLNNNQLAGPIPTELGNLKGLIEALDLSSNLLSGPIPIELGSLEDLSDLRLHTNKLTDTIPTELAQLTSLTVLWISDTRLVDESGEVVNDGIKGTIPTELGSLSALESLYLQNNQLTGTIPAGLVSLNIAEFDVSGNQLDTYNLKLLADRDNDGVPNYLDQCPDEGGFIHADGCPVDSDNDGVRDCVSTSVKDECHSTTGSASDLNDACCDVERDYCPDNTPRGATVSTKLETINGETIDPGCPLDTDGDTVYDGLDRCPDTTAEELAMIADSTTMVLDEKGCVVLSPQMWEPTFVEEATVVSTMNGMPHLDLLFTVNKELYTFAKARADLPLVQSQVMDASCINAFDDLTDTSIERLSSLVAENPEQVSYTGEISADAVPVMVGLDFDISKLIGSTVWTEEPNGVASIDFCLKLSVLSYTDASDTATAEVVTYENIKTSILLDTEQDFSVIGTKIKLDEAGAAEATIDVEYPLEACRCDDDDACVNSESLLSQGQALKVCIRFAPDADNGGVLPPDFVKMTDVKSFTCSQNSVSMQPIDDFARQGVEGQLTSVKTINKELATGGSYTQDDRMLIVTTQLLGSFFGPQELPVDCSGTVVYEFEAGSGVLADESASQRLLSQISVALAPEQSLRRVAEEDTAEAEAEAESEFSINIMLAKAKTENGRGIGGNRGAIAGIAIAGVMIAGVAVASVSAVVGVGATAAGGTAAAGSSGSAMSVMAKLFGRPPAAPPAPAAPVQSQPLAEMNEVGGQEVAKDFCVVTGSVA